MRHPAVNITVFDVLRSADAFVQRLQAIKASIADIRWYPYNSISSLGLLSTLTEGIDIPANAVLDLGAADGDISFLFADAGSSVDAFESAESNFNKGDGLRRLNDAFGKPVSLTFTDVDFRFDLPRDYDLCFATGIAYHLRNPLLVYLTLAQHCRFMVANTRVIDIPPSESRVKKVYWRIASRLHRLQNRQNGETRFSRKPFAYLLDRREINNDPTNYWLFTPACYRRVLKRCGWKILCEVPVGASIGTLDADKRVWTLCERVQNYADLKLHHDF
jgi:tRNA (mo5U34)-methyltransferase